MVMDECSGDGFCLAAVHRLGCYRWTPPLPAPDDDWLPLSVDAGETQREGLQRRRLPARGMKRDICALLVADAMAGGQGMADADLQNARPDWRWPHFTGARNALMHDGWVTLAHDSHGKRHPLKRGRPPSVYVESNGPWRCRAAADGNGTLLLWVPSEALMNGRSDLCSDELGRRRRDAGEDRVAVQPVREAGGRS